MTDTRIIDVAIAGAGPAGAWLARELARAGRSVVLYERSPVPGEPNFSSAGTTIETAELFDLPKDCIASTWDKLFISGPTVSREWTFKEPVGHVYDFRKLKIGLVEEARQAGVDVRLGTGVTGYVQGDGNAVMQAAPADRSCTARIVVDASGPTGVLAVQAGLRKKKMCPPSSGLEVLCEHESFREHQRAMVVYFGRWWAPYGYAWIFPMGGVQVKVGVCTYMPDERDHDKDLNVMLKNFMQRVDWLAPGKIVETHGGYLYLTGGIDQHVSGNMIAIGDAADQVHPLYGEGIRHVLHSARMAKTVIYCALDTGNAGELNAYNDLWKGYVGNDWKRAAKVGRHIYPKMSDRGYDMLMRFVALLPGKTVYNIGFRYKAPRVIRPVLRLLTGGRKKLPTL